MQNSSNKIDMLNGSLVDKLIIFAAPLALTSILQQLFNAADMIVCGRFVGSNALAAVGANSQVINLFINSFLGLSIGANVMIENYIGAGKNEKIHNMVHTAMSFAYAFGLVLMIIGLIFADKFLIFLGTPLEIMIDATVYLRILFVSMPFLITYNFGAAILRSIGDTKRPLIVLTITGLLNVILNICFVVLVKLGVIGVAISTLITTAISAIVVVILLTKEKGLIHYNVKEFILDPRSINRIMRIGIPTAVQGIVFSLSNLCVQSAINSLGTKTMAANVAALNFEMFPYFIFTSFSSACITFMSQNFGAEKFDRCKLVFRDCVILGAAFSLFITIFLQIYAKELLHIFSNDSEVVEIAIVRMRLACALSWTQTLYDTAGAGLRVLKHPILPTVMVILGTVVFRIIWIMTVFPNHRSYFTVAVVYPLSWVIINIAMGITYTIVSGQMLKKPQEI